jgi:hypothetical protein
MKKRKLIASIALSTLVLTAWSVISWTILPFHSNSLKNLNKQVVDIKAMQGLMASGVYHYPGLPTNNSKENWDKLEEQLKTEPRITLMVYHDGGSSLFDLKSFAINVFFNLITSGLLVLAITLAASKKTLTIITLVFIIGLIVCFSKSLPFLVWFKFPITFIVPDLVDTVVSFLLVGMLLNYTNKI